MNRRFLLAGLAVAGATPAILTQSRVSRAAFAEVGPMADPAGVKTASDFFQGVIPRAELSLVTSQAAVGKATQKSAKEFAGFEFGEAITVNMIIKDMDITAPVLGEDANAMFATMDMAEKHGRHLASLMLAVFKEHTAICKRISAELVA